MDEIVDPERITRIGEAIIECETGAELLARARETDVDEEADPSLSTGTHP